MTNLSIFNQLRPFSVGFDDMFDHFDSMVSMGSSNYPPYNIVKAFSIFGDKMKAIELCVARFDDDTKESFLNLYTKIDAGVTVDSLNSDTQTQVEEDEKEPEEEDAVSTI